MRRDRHEGEAGYPLPERGTPIASARLFYGGSACRFSWTYTTWTGAFPATLFATLTPRTSRFRATTDVNYKSYWVSEAEGKIFCLVEAPDAETATRVHREAHGLEADEIYEVIEGS